jgi:hypothetical protein
MSDQAKTTLTALVSRVRLPYRVWRCGTCDTEGQLTYRCQGDHAGWVVTCPCPACPAPEVPAGEYNPSSKAAIRHWNWKQGGPK